MIPLIRPADREAALWVASHLRKADEQEVWAASGHSPEEALPHGVENAREAYVACAGDEPTVLFGVTDEVNQEGLGIPWLLATDKVALIVRGVLKETPLWLSYWIRRYYPIGLHNIVDERNRHHMRWIGRVGFEFGERLWIGDYSFRHFTMYNEENIDV